MIITYGMIEVAFYFLCAVCVLGVLIDGLIYFLESKNQDGEE